MDKRNGEVNDEKGSITTRSEAERHRGGMKRAELVRGSLILIVLCLESIDLGSGENFYLKI